MGIVRLIGTGLCWGTLLVIIGAAVGCFIVYSQLDNEVQKHVLEKLKEGYPELDVQVGSAQIVENKGILVRNIEFAVPHSSGNPRKLLRIDELFVECPVTLHTLYQKDLRISRIVVKEPILRASRAADGTFAELQLLARGDTDPLFLFPDEEKPIAVEIQNGILLYDDARQSTMPLQLSGINIAVTPEMQGDVPRILAKGTADGDFFRRLIVEAEILPETKQWRVTANCRQFDWSDDLWQYLPAHPQMQERPLFQGRFDFNVSAVSDPASEEGYRFAIGGTLMHGRLDLPHVDRTFTELSTRFEISNDGIVIDKLTGNSDGAQLAADYVQEGLTFSDNQRRRAELTLNVRNLRFNDTLIESLSPFLNDATEALLARFDYEGMTDVHAQLLCRDGAWHPKSIEMQISEIGFAYREFPYRLDRLAGNLLVDETAALHFRFTTKLDSALKAVIEGHYSNIFVDPAGKVEIIGENVPIDPKLMHALPLAVQQVTNSLNPSGKLKSRLIFELPPGDVPLKKQFDIALDQVSLRYDHFPYPLREVTGFLHYDGNVWQFRDVSGTNGAAVVKGNGHLCPIGDTHDDAQEFVLHVSAAELPIDDQITQALLNSDQRQLLQSLNVNGKVNLAAQIQYRTDDRNLNLAFQADPLSGLSIQSNRLPCKIENIEGKIQYENGRVFAETLMGVHRGTKLRSKLDCRFDVDGQSVFRLEELAIDQLQANREFLDALPVYFRDFLESLEMTRPFNLSGRIEYRQTAQGEQAVAWDLNCILHQNSAKLGLYFENIFGIIRLTGQSAGNQLRLAGELNLDSLMVNGFQATSVRGPFAFDGKQLQLGVPMNLMRPDIPARRLTGRFCDGIIYADGWVVPNGMSYAINADLMGADLAKIVREIEPTIRATSGTLNCVNLNLRGIGAKWETVSGSGTIQQRNANIYGAPMMVRMLRELRIRDIDPDAGMFSSVDVDFRISGLQMFFDSVILEGNALSVFGDGMMQLDSRQVDLTMKTRLGNRRTQIPIISPIIGGVGDQLVQLRISGPVSDPTVARVALPELQQALEQIQVEDNLPPLPPPNSRSRLAPSRMFQWNPL